MAACRATCHRLTTLLSREGAHDRVTLVPSSDYLRWSIRPSLRRPVIVAAFAGWSDAGDAATITARYVRDSLGARPFAELDAEEFYDFAATRPQVRLREGSTREIVWPANQFSAAAAAGASHDLIVLVGIEPQLRWRTFCSLITDVAKDFDAAMLITLGALLADVPHSRPVRIIGTAADPEMSTVFGLQRSRYEGPTGIVGTLNYLASKAGIPTASLWAATPSYASSVPSPKAALALAGKLAEMVSLRLDLAPLAAAAHEYEQQVGQHVANDSDLAPYVQRLEAAYDRGELDEQEDDDEETAQETPPLSEASADALVEEVERFLRDQGNT